MPKKLRSQPPAPPDDSSRYIPLTREKFALVDASDYDFLMKWNWYAMETRSLRTGKQKFYAASCTSRSVGKRTILMHRLIMDAPKGKEVDHHDNDGLNNRRSNIRMATSTENKYNIGLRVNNSSGHKGVSWYKALRKWRVTIRFNGRDFWLGYFTSKKQAATAYAEAAKKYHGEFARVS